MEMDIGNDTGTSELAWHRRFSVNDSVVHLANLKLLRTVLVSGGFGVVVLLVILVFGVVHANVGGLVVDPLLVFLLVAVLIGTTLFRFGLFFLLVDLCPRFRGQRQYVFWKWWWYARRARLCRDGVRIHTSQQYSMTL